MPLAALALLVVNDVWLKPTFHSTVTGKLSDIAVCFLMPLFLSELLGFLGVAPKTRLLIGGLVTATLFAGLEVVPACTTLALRLLAIVGPRVGIHRAFRMTSDWTDLFCVLLIPAALAYGKARVCSSETAIRR